MSNLPTFEDFLHDRLPPGLLPVDRFVQRQPGDGVPGSQRTTAYLFRDERTLFVVFVCLDSEPGRVRSRLAKRDTPVPDDLVGILLDTFHDHRRAYLFLVNPAGVQRDAVLTEGQGEDYSFDTVWQSRAQLTARGYVAWIAIPFRSLRFAGDASDVWGVGVTRRIPRNSEELYWPFVSRMKDALVPQLAPIGGFAGVSPGRNIQLIPYGTFTAADLRADATEPFQRTDDAQAGMDAKVVVADRATIDVTANPDFSQVESDDPQVTINQRYEVYFPEKRPFFLEGGGFFLTPEPWFFSRRIVSPRWGARMTGKLGRWNLGSLIAADRLTRTGDERADVGVVRLQRELGRESSVGGLWTSRQTTQGDEHLVAADTRMRLSARWTLQAQVSRSLRRQGGTDTTGTSTVVEIGAADRHWTFVNRYLDRSPGFTAPLGFLQRADIRQTVQVTNYRWRPQSRTVLALGPGVTWSETWSYNGQSLDRVVSPHFGIEFGGATQVLLTGFINRETFASTPFDVRATQVQVNSSWLRWLELSGFYQRGDRINYAPAPGQLPFLAHTRDAFVRAALRPGPRVSFEQTYIVAALRSRDELRAEVFTNHLARTKVVLQLTRAASLRGILDYAETRANAALTVSGNGRRVTGDVLFTYQPGPFTSFYLGYGTQAQQSGEISQTPDASTAFWRLPVTGRQAFAKISYGLKF